MAIATRVEAIATMVEARVPLEPKPGDRTPPLLFENRITDRFVCCLGYMVPYGSCEDILAEPEGGTLGFSGRSASTDVRDFPRLTSLRPELHLGRLFTCGFLVSTAIFLHHVHGYT